MEVPAGASKRQCALVYAATCRASVVVRVPRPSVVPVVGQRWRITIACASETIGCQLWFTPPAALQADTS